MSPSRTTDDVLQYGLRLVGQDHNRVSAATNARRFSSHYGLPPLVWLHALDDIRRHLGEAHPGFSTPSLKKLLMTAYWMKQSATYEVVASRFGCSERSVRHWVWEYARGLASLKGFKVSRSVIALSLAVMSNTICQILWGNFGPDDLIIFLTVDGVHFKIKEPRKVPSTRWYSHKFNGPGLSYEVAIAIHVNQICWVNGPFPAATSDRTIFVEEGLQAMIPEGKLALGDSTYAGADKICAVNDNDSEEVRAFKMRARARQENINEHLKRFRILTDTFRYDVGKHATIVHAIAVLTQYDIENERPLNAI